MADNVIPFPRHGCAVGRRVKWRHECGEVLRGVIVKNGKCSAQVLDDHRNGRTVRHELLVPIDGELPRRERSVVLAEIARCYVRLDRTIGRRVLGASYHRRLRQRLKDLFAELGRTVSREEALGDLVLPGLRPL